MRKVLLGKLASGILLVRSNTNNYGKVRRYLPRIWALKLTFGIDISKFLNVILNSNLTTTTKTCPSYLYLKARRKDPANDY